MPKKAENPGQCLEHSGLLESVKLTISAFEKNAAQNTENTNKIYEKLNDVCVKLEHVSTQTGQNEKDINNLGTLKANSSDLKNLKEEDIKNLKDSINFQKRMFWSGFISLFILLIGAFIKLK